MFKPRQEDDSDKSRLQNLQERLYSKNNAAVFKDRRSVIHATSQNTNTEWAELPQDQIIDTSISDIERGKVFSRFSHVIFYSAFFVFFLAISFSLYHFIWGVKIVTPEKIAVNVEAPSFINGGEIFPIDIYVTNKNKSALEKVDLIIEYPKGEKITTQEEADIKRLPIGTIATGATAKGTTEIVLYGREGNLRDIKIFVEYYSGGSSIVRKKEIAHQLTLKAAPVVLTTESFKEVSSNEELVYTTHIRAERGIDLNNFIVNIEYPNGFQFISSEPVPRYGNNVWSFEKIEKGSVVDIIVRGRVRGEDGDEKVFRVAGGSADRADSSKLGIVYADTRSSVIVQKPFISLRGSFDAAVNPSTGEFSLRAGERVTGQFEYQNNLNDTISNTVVTAKLSGEILNRQRVLVPGGFYDSSKNTIIWDRSTTPALASILPGQKGVLKFQIQSYLLNAKQNGYFSQPQIIVEAMVRGKRLSDSSVPEQTAASSPLIGKIITEAGIRAEVLGKDAPSSNNAIEIPIVEKTSTYTLSLAILNRSNTLSDAKVTFVLPQNVTYVDKKESQDEIVTYDINTRTVTWLPSVIVPDTGFGKPEKKVYLQLTLTPSVTESGAKPTITSQINFTAFDSYTGTNIISSAAAVLLPVIVQ